MQLLLLNLKLLPRVYLGLAGEAVEAHDIVEADAWELVGYTVQGIALAHGISDVSTLAGGSRLG